MEVRTTCLLWLAPELAIPMNKISGVVQADIMLTRWVAVWRAHVRVTTAGIATRGKIVQRQHVSTHVAGDLGSGPIVR